MRNGIGDASAVAATNPSTATSPSSALASRRRWSRTRWSQTGKRIVVLDSRDIAQGSTAASTALLQYEIDTHLVDLVRMLGAERGDARLSRLRARASRCWSSDSRNCCRRPDTNAGRACIWLPMRRSVPTLRAELAARRGIGIACEWLDGEARCAAAFRLPPPGRDSLRARRAGGSVPPDARGCSPRALRHGVRLFARTKVAQIEEGADALRLRTAAGHVVTAAHVVVCGGYESLDFLPPEFADINNTFALVTEPLERRERLATMPLMWESDRPYLYLRGTPDGRLLVGRRRRAVQERHGARSPAAAADQKARGPVPGAVWRGVADPSPTPGLAASRKPAMGCH